MNKVKDKERKVYDSPDFRIIELQLQRIISVSNQSNYEQLKINKEETDERGCSNQSTGNTIWDID